MPEAVEPRPDSTHGNEWADHKRGATDVKRLEPTLRLTMSRPTKDSCPQRRSPDPEECGCEEEACFRAYSRAVELELEKHDGNQKSEPARKTVGPHSKGGYRGPCRLATENPSLRASRFRRLSLLRFDIQQPMAIGAKIMANSRNVQSPRAGYAKNE